MSPSDPIQSALLSLHTSGLAGYFLYPKVIATGKDSTADKSIAVLPFENMSNDPEQEYFSNGITEDILNHLVKIADLRVKSRTSTLSYKDNRPSVRQIGEDLGVAYLVEGSVRRAEDKVRIVVQLIDVKTDVHLWSETYDRELKDVLALQSEIAIKIVGALEVRLTTVEKANIEKKVSQDVTAYDYFLKAREVFKRSNYEKRNLENALLLANQAIQLDSTFAPAYALKGSIWFELSTFGAISKTWQDSVSFFSAKAISIDASSSDGFLVQGKIKRFFLKTEESKTAFRNAFELAPNDPDVLRAYGNLLLSERNEKGADLVLKANENQYSLKDPEYYLSFTGPYTIVGDFTMREKLLKKAKSLNPGLYVPYERLGYLYWDMGQYEKGIHEAEEADKISPGLFWISDQLGWLHYLNNDFENAAKYWSHYIKFEATFEDSTQRLERHRLGMVYAKMGRKKDADALFAEDLKINTERLMGKRGVGAGSNLRVPHYGLAVDYSYLGNSTKAVQCLDSALKYEFYWLRGYDKDPMFAELKDRDDFKKVIKKLDDYKEFMKRAFSNALNRMEANKELKNSLK